MTQQPGPSVNAELATRLAIDAYRAMKLAEIDAEVLTSKLMQLLATEAIPLEEYVLATDAIDSAADEARLFLDATDKPVSSKGWRQEMRRAVRSAGHREKVCRRELPNV